MRAIMRGKLLGAAILLAFFAGWIMTFASIYELWMIRAVHDWPSRPGEITVSYVRSPRGFGGRRYLDVEIAGVYAGTPERFYAARVGYGIQHSVWTRARAARFVARFPVATKLEVFHEPGNARRAILVRDHSTRPTWIALAIALAAGLLPVVLYVYSRLTGFGRKLR
jgi:hypothetical protein